MDPLFSSVNNNCRSKFTYRILEFDENIWKVQSRWRFDGRFLLEKLDLVDRFIVSLYLISVYANQNFDHNKIKFIP